MCVSDNKRVEMASNLSREKMQSVLNQLNLMWDARNFADANCLFQKYIDMNIEDKIGIQFKANLCGLLTDVCDLAKTEKIEEYLFFDLERSLEKAIEYQSKNLSQIQKIYKEGIANYNYATSLSTLYSFKRLKDRDYLLPKNAELLVKAKKQFWIAIRASKGKMKLEMMTNLAHVLSNCNRITECLYLYDQVLGIESNFPQANYSKAQSLEYLNMLSSGYSINQLYEIYKCYKNAALSSLVCHPNLQEQAKLKSEYTYKLILEEGSDEDAILKDCIKNKEEFSQHSKKRKFFIKNGMALSEHSLYCGCSGSRKDNLTILTHARPIGGDFVPRMEHILNQLKTEYFKARELFYNSSFNGDEYYRPLNEKLCLTDLGDFDASGVRAEDLRLSFKTCYSILDKIALSLCELYDFPLYKNEKIYFESFWKKTPSKDEGTYRDRWEEINLIEENPSLFALYFQSTDLNSKNGEWKDFKKWRNSLEHGFFVLTSEKAKEAPYGILDRKFKVEQAEYDVFKERTAELLRFVRSAIFNFVFCVRREAERLLEDEDYSSSEVTITFDKKQP